MSLSFWPLIRDPLFRIDGKEVTFRRRGFEVSSPVAQTHLEQVGTSFLLGYHLAIDSRDMTELSETLSACDAEYQGFSYEGAAMGLGLLDALSLGNKRRWQRFLDGPANSHRYVVHVGLGWVVARLPWLRSRPERAMDMDFMRDTFTGRSGLRKRNDALPFRATHPVHSIRVWAVACGLSLAAMFTGPSPSSQHSMPTGTVICGVAWAWLVPMRESPQSWN